MLDDLIADSPDSAFERATLPKGIEKKLAKVDWNKRDVLVGSLRNRAQLGVCLQHKFYHVPASRIPDDKLPIRHIAIYQSKSIFGQEGGIRYYGEVTKCIPVLRRDIKEIQKNSDERYYRFEVKEWKELSKPIMPKEIPFAHLFTNLFLLEHSAETPELTLRSEQEFRFYSELKRALHHAEINDESAETGFLFDDAMIVFENGKINVYQDKRITASYSVDDFSRKPGAVFRNLHNSISK